MKMFAMLFAGLAMVFSSIGCCCMSNGCNSGACCPPAYGAYGGGCSTGNCGVAPGGVPQGFAPQGMYQNYNTIQTGYAGSVPSPIVTGAAYPQPVYSGVASSPFAIPQTASAPLEPLPTY